MKTRKILLSINPEYVDKIMAGTKRFEYRKTRCKSDIDTIVIYATAPVMRVVGTVRVLDILTDSPDRIWQQTKDFSGISKQFFDTYFHGRETAVAYKLGKITRYNKPIPLSHFGITAAPQSFIYLNNIDPMRNIC